MWKNTAGSGGPQMIIWRMCMACWVTKATNTHSEYVILTVFHDKNGCMNGPEYYIIRALSVLLSSWVDARRTTGDHSEGNKQKQAYFAPEFVHANRRVFFVSRSVFLRGTTQLRQRGGGRCGLHTGLLHTIITCYRSGCDVRPSILTACSGASGP